MGFFYQLIASTIKVNDYPKLLKLKMSKAIFYLFILTFFCGALILGVFYAKISALGGLEGLAEEYIPEFIIEDGMLALDDVYEYDLEDSAQSVKIYADTTGNADISVVKGYDQFLYVDEYGLVIQSDSDIQKLEFSEFEKCSKADIVEWMPNVNKYIIIFAVICVVFYFLALLFGLVWAAVIALIIDAIAIHSGIGFGEGYKLVIYSRTTSVILELCATVLLGLAVSGLGFVFTIISLIYMVVGLKKLKADRESPVEPMAVEGIADVPQE